MSKWIARILVVILILGFVDTANAQYPDPWYTSYQVQNIGSSPTDVRVNYYDEGGVLQSEASTQYPQVPPGGSITILQKATDNPDDYDDHHLGDGRFSAVIAADQPIAAVVNQQLVPDGTAGFEPIAPFSSYTGDLSGSTEVILPVVMANWFGYYTEVFIQNVGTGVATIDISYYPTSIDGLVTGAEGQTDTGTIPQFASIHRNQEAISDTLGAPQIVSGTLYIDSIFTGRFLGAAVIRSDQPVVAVVNQHQISDHKLFTYNGFSTGDHKIVAPIYMRNHFGYYASLTIANVSLSKPADVTITYMADNEYSKPEENQGKTVSVQYQIPAGESINRYDGQPASSPDQSDLNGSTGNIHFDQFFGTVTIESDQPIVAIINQEAIKVGDAQAGTYSALDTNVATPKVSVPLVQANFFAYYTSLTLQSTTGATGEVFITYTSDDMYSSVTGVSKTYAHSIVGSQPLNIYEGTKGNIKIGDINADPAIWADSNGNIRFIGSAIITSTVPIVAFANAETDISGVDTMYTFNTFNLTP